MTVVVLLIMAFSAPNANAAWLMMVDSSNSDVQCPKEFTLVSVTTNANDILACVPNNTADNIKKTDVTATSDDKTPQNKHDGTYDGTPVQSPMFN